MDYFNLDIEFLDLTGIPDDEVNHLKKLLNPANHISSLELPWKTSVLEATRKPFTVKESSQCSDLVNKEQCYNQPSVNVDGPDYRNATILPTAHPETVPLSPPYVPAVTSVTHFQNMQPIHFIPRPMFSPYAMRVPLAANVGQHGTQEMMMMQQPFHSPLSSSESDGRPDDGRTKQRTMGITNKQYRQKTKKKHYGMMDNSSIDVYNPVSSTVDKQLYMGMQSPNQMDPTSDGLTNNMNPMSHSIPGSLPTFLHSSYGLGPGALPGVLPAATAAYSHMPYSPQHPPQQMIYLYNPYTSYITQAQTTSPVVTTVAPVLEGNVTTHSLESYNCAIGDQYERQDLNSLQGHSDLNEFSPHSGQELCCDGSENLESVVSASAEDGFQESKSLDCHGSTVMETVDTSCENEYSAQNTDVTTSAIDSVNPSSESEQRTNSPKCETVVNNCCAENFSLENSPNTCNNAYANNQMSWADLFKGKSGAADTNSSVSSGKTNMLVEKAESKDSINTVDSTSFQEKFIQFLQSYQIDFAPKSVQPRGLINKSNWCYINATLQAILMCPPFYNLIDSLSAFSSQSAGKSPTPIMDSLVELFSDFTQLPTLSKIKHKDDLNVGAPFEPVCIHKMLSVIKSECVKGRQEDAEEFLSCILNGLHEELLGVMKIATAEKGTTCNGTAESNGHILEESDEDDWQVQGPKKRSMITRSAALSSSPIKDIFGGETRSVLTAGSENSAVLQPFFTLQLDIQSDGIESVKDALGQLTVKEPVQDYICPKTKKEVDAYRRTTLEELPPVLILHFKRFVYDKDGGSKKVLKQTDYPMELELGKELLSLESKCRNKAKDLRSYRLFAVVYHDGKEAMKGHYIADVYHAGMESWLRCDDRNIVLTTEAQVQRYNSPCVPYLLFYGRAEGHHATPSSK